MSSAAVAQQLKSFYRRELPSRCVNFASREGKLLFREALERGHMENYFSLAAQFHTQSEPAYCGLGTLAMVLNALAIDPKRVWKGPWRWFSEELLECCKPLEVVKQQGTTVNEFACLARCNGADCSVFYATESNENSFREAVTKTTRAEGSQIVVGYNRETLGQTGAGHFSPVGGYHPDRDLVLIMDVARFKYPPHWVELPLLFSAMKDTDPATNRSRGYMVLTPNAIGPRLAAAASASLSSSSPSSSSCNINSTNNNVGSCSSSPSSSSPCSTENEDFAMREKIEALAKDAAAYRSLRA
ncbi:glutathione gamma-glutamylcysteinyltransferase [Balamuthia mandrillaris]